MYGALDKNGERVGNPIKSSRIGDYAGIGQIEKHCADNKDYLKELPRRKALTGRIRGIVAGCMRLRETSQADIEKRLEERGITAIFRTNEDGRLTGATFIDHRGKNVYNGSNLGKDLSANSWHSLFNTNDGPLFSPPVEEPVQGPEAIEQDNDVAPEQEQPQGPETDDLSEEYEEVWERVGDEEQERQPYRKSHHSDLGLFEKLPSQNPDFERIDPEFKAMYKKKKKRKRRI